MTNEEYYTNYVSGTESWPSITEEEFNTAKAAVVAALSVI
jgi:hypothetical protein